MIPRTYPTTYVTANGKQQMVVFFLSSVSGLQRFKDYIPVSFPQYGDQKDNSYDNNGVVLVDVLSSSSGKQAWKDYIPVFVESNAADAWRVSINGYIPVGLATAPSLALDFTSSSQTLDPRITFSRTSNATVTDSSGTIRYAPHNLLTFSEQFDNAYWQKSNSSVTTNAVVAPNGTTTADNLIENTATSAHLINVLSAPSISASTAITGSIYVKAAGRTFCRLRLYDSVGLIRSAAVNLTTGAITFENGTGTTSVTSVGNGWYRIAVSGTTAATATTANIDLYIRSDEFTESYTGNGTSGLSIWGAQLNVSNMVGGVTSSLSTYYPTTVKNLLGFSEAFDNAAWTKSNSFIQTNLLQRSEEFDNAAWSKITATITPNIATAPNDTVTADKLIVANGQTAGYASLTISFVSGTTYTVSCYAKASEVSDFRFVFESAAFGSNLNAVFNLSTGVVSSFTVSSASIQNVGNGWYRCVATATATATASAGLQFRSAHNGNGTNGIFIWGAQLVQGSTPGDYQQTFSAAMPVMYRAPNGTMTADKLVENTATATHPLFQSASVISGTRYTFSAYVKAAERTFCRVEASGAAMTAGAINVNLSTGATTTDGTVVSSSATAVGDGWYRISVTATAASSGNGNFVVYPSTSLGVTNYAGNGTNGIYIWGAQLSDSASLDTYVNNPGVAPSSVAYYGPRFDYNPTTLAPRGLLIEEQRTNLLQRSEELATSPWFNGGLTSITNNTTDVLDPSGNNKATKLVVSGSAGIVAQGAGTLTAAVYTGSIWLRCASGTVTGSLIVYMSGSPFTNIGTQNITITTTWQRFTVTTSNASAVGYNFQVHNLNGGTVYAWGAQFELGAFATSYIPTTTASATRNEDVISITGSNFSGFYNQNEGTLFTDALSQRPTTDTTRILAISDGTANNSIRINAAATSLAVVVSGSTEVSFSQTYTANSFNKFIIGYKVNDVAGTINAASVSTDTSVNIPVVNQIEFGRLANGTSGSRLVGYIRKVAYYPKRLTNAELQSITA